MAETYESPFSDLKPSDLDPKSGLFKLNAALRRLHEQLNELQGAGGNSQIVAPVTAPKFTAKTPYAPESDNDLLTFGAAKTLFGPATMHDALTNGSWQGTVVKTITSSISTATLISDTHASRASVHAASNLVDGSLFWETDRNVWYIVRSGAWYYLLGTMTGTVATPGDTRPTDLGVADTGFLFQATDTRYLYMWDGEGWTTSQPLVDTHANRVANFDATKLAEGTLFYESDRTVYYIVKAHAWVYYQGTMHGTLSPNQKPADLGAGGAGFLFHATDNEHLYRWSGSGWGFAPGDSGAGFIVAGSSAPVGGAWGLCDGTAYAVAQANGTTATVTTPDLTGDVFIKGGTPGDQQEATAPKWDTGAKTAAKSAGTPAGSVSVSGTGDSGSTGAPSGTTEVATGTGATVASSTHTHTFDGTGGGSGTFTGTPMAEHDHDLTDVLSKLKPPSEADGGLPLRIALAWYIRL